MGMSASQARLLFITSRQHDVEFKSQQIANQKIRLATESEQVAADYSKALNKETLTMFDKKQNMQDQEVTIDRLLDNGYSLRTNKGETIGRKTGINYDTIKQAGYKAQYKSSLAYSDVGINDLPKGWTVETKDGTPVKQIDTVNPVYTTSTDGTKHVHWGGEDSGHYNVSASISKYNQHDLQRALGVVDNALYILNDNSLGSSEKERLMWSYMDVLNNGTKCFETKGFADNIKDYMNANNLDSQNIGYTAYNDNGSHNSFSSDLTSIMAAAMANDGASTTRTGNTWNNNIESIINANLQMFRSMILSQIAMVSYTDNENADKNESFLISSIANGDYVIKDANGQVRTLNDLLASKNPNNKKEITSSNFDSEYAAGNVEIVNKNGNIATEDDLSKISQTSVEYGSDFIKKFKENSDYLIQGLLMGAFTLYDSDGKQVSLSSDSHFTTKHDKSNDAQAEADYNAKSAKIKTKEKILDNELNKLNTEHQALQTEYESAKNVISENVKRTFNMFS